MTVISVYGKPGEGECGAPYDLFGKVRVYCNAPAPCPRGLHSYDSPSGFTVEWAAPEPHVSGSEES